MLSDPQQQLPSPHIVTIAMKLDVGKWQGSVITQPVLTTFSTSHSHTASTGKYILNGPQSNNLFFCSAIISLALPVAMCSPYTLWRCFVLLPSAFSCFREKDTKSEEGGSQKEGSGIQTKDQRSSRNKQTNKTKTKIKKGKEKMCCTNGSETWELMFERNTMTLSMQGVQRGIGMLLWKSKAPF